VTDRAIDTPSATDVSRRDFLKAAALCGAVAVWRDGVNDASPSRVTWQERRDLYPEGVASGDPDSHSVLLWTRRPFDMGDAVARHALTVEVSTRHVQSASADIVTDADVTTLRNASSSATGGLAPARTYWYRFTDEHGYGSRVGRTPHGAGRR
jgi:alkaline phosphatase D